MKVSLILNNFLPSTVAGTEVYVWSLAKKLITKGANVEIVIPNYSKIFSSIYIYDDLIVNQFAEPSIVDRKLIMGFRKPNGLISFVKYLQTAKPDIVHFHEIAGSNGITLHHVEEAKKFGAKVLFTFHLAGLSCMTGTLYENGEFLCDGKIEIKKCTECYLQSKGLSQTLVKFFSTISRYLYHLSLNPTKIASSLSTAFGTASLVEKKQADIFNLISYCDKVVVLTNWYKQVLISNGIDKDKIILISQALPFDTLQINQHQKQNDITKFIFLGRITYPKGLHLLIDAFTQLDQSKAELHIYGQSDESDYEKNLKQKTISFRSIYWHGTLNHSKVLSVMSEFDAICICSTITEMAPLVIQEAFAAGLPVIASNVYGNAEQIKHDVNGLLFKFNDSADLLKQLQRCINEKDLLPNLSSNILPPRSFKEVANEHIKLYNSLLS